MRSSLVHPLFALLLVTTQGMAADVEAIFRSQDTDGDGAISVAEARASAPAAFAAIDRNGDGVVGVDEIAAHMVAESGPDMAWPAPVLNSVAQKTLEYWDADHDGKVTGPEYEDASVALMLLADSDGDRKVTREELLRFRGEAPAP
ncbi:MULTISPECIES: EF-hand domain-containing protein [Pseudomonas]|uniref:EF-hand domain-containing protein n=1 Tax=Pseudomonas TaxID=286 RepID=UPI0021DA6AE6|nr:EF-hand domain-containing protein [Pseudomonas tohonis]UXY55537.1 EF-hand domain-containing protein [Pseudomonas tohonis]